MTRTFWVFIALVVILALLTFLGDALSALTSPAVGAMAVSIVWLGLAALAIYDGGSRILGHRGILGSGSSRLSRALAVIQVMLGLIVLVSVLSGFTVEQGVLPSMVP